MSCAATMTISGFNVSRSSAHPRHAPTGGRDMQLFRRLGRTLAAVGLFLGGAYPEPRVRRMVRVR